MSGITCKTRVVTTLLSGGKVSLMCHPSFFDFVFLPQTLSRNHSDIVTPFLHPHVGNQCFKQTPAQTIIHTLPVICSVFLLSNSTDLQALFHKAAVFGDSLNTALWIEGSWKMQNIHLHTISSPTSPSGSEHNTAATLFLFFLLGPNHHYGYKSEGIITVKWRKKGRLGSFFPLSIFSFPSYAIFLVCGVAHHAWKWNYFIRSAVTAPSA